MPLNALAAGLLLLAWQQAVPSDLPILPLGRGDVINVTVEDEPDLSKRLKISDKGEITMPLLKEPLRVEGLLPAETENLIVEAYKHQRLLINPLVNVTPAEYHSYLVRVTGEVTRPYEFQAIERTTLLSVLATAGGPTPESNGDIEVIRRDAAGKETRQVIAIRTLLEDSDPRYNMVMKGGEEVHLPRIPPANSPGSK
jgi:polysaccharide export outer membrane protein